jgi:uncharacterized membrane protein
MIRLEAVYVVLGILLAGVAAFSARDASNPKRWRNTGFWGLFAASFLFGGRLSDFANGCLILTMALIAGVGSLGQGAAAKADEDLRALSAARLGNRLLIPILTVPAVTLVGVLVLARFPLWGQLLIDPKQSAPISLALGTCAALAAAFVIFRPRPLAPLAEAERLVNRMGWAFVLPQALASLGAVFTLAGLGPIVGGALTHWLPMGSPLAAVCLYSFGMAAFTVIMGNAFAAFPVMITAVGLPLLVRKFGGDVAVVGALGMLSGYCGTLVSPLAANFNYLPVALLQLRDREAVIKVQAPAAAAVFVGNTLLMFVLAFRHRLM